MLVCDGRVLLGLRGPSARSHQGQWDVIGGHCEPGETDEKTMVRELNEELGIVPTRYESVGVLAEDIAEARYLLHVFVVLEWDGIPTNCSREHSKIAWFSPPGISKLDLTSPSLVPLLAKIASSSPHL